MKTSLIALAVLSQVGQVFAFPAVAEAAARDAEARDVEKRDHSRGQEGGFHEPNTRFNAAFQHVSVSGKHKFVPPNFEKGDQRGPCPGLNALANHGYLPHNGIGSMKDFQDGTFAALGMGLDIATILTTIGQVLDGNGLKWSIGGPSKYLPAPLGGLLGAPQGISGSHNKYESDVSPGRGDLYMYGNDYKLQMDQFQQLYDMGIANGDQITLEVLREFRSKRFDHSIANNPYLFLGPFSGVLVAPAAFEFIYRFMSNKSEEHPHGLLNTEVLMSFFAVHKDKETGKLVHKEGWERIPYNWYKRAKGDAYTQTRLNEDTLTAALAQPKFLSVGGNTGKVNSFKGIDPKDISGGVFNSKNLLQGNNLACFAFGFQQQASPDLLKCSKIFGKDSPAPSLLTGALEKILTELKCPRMTKIDTTQFKQFPGYKNLNCKTGKYNEVP